MANSKDIELIIKARDLASQPIAEINKSVGQLTDKVQDLVPASARGEAGIKDLEAVAAQLESALRGLAANQAIIERFKLLTTQFGEASTKLRQFRERSDEAILTLSKAAEPTRQLQQDVTGASLAFSTQERLVARLALQLSKLGSQASAAGIDIQNLATAERQINAVLSQAAPAFQKVNTAIDQHRVTAERAATPYARMRGEVLSLVASYVGLQAAVQGVGSILDVVQKKNTIENSFAVAFGDKAPEQMKFVEQQAERLGFRMLDLADSYGKFAIASTSAGTSLADTQAIFQSFTEVSRSLHLSTENTGLVFLALEQIMSKGKVTMQDLRQQLGNALPGVMGVFAKSLGVPQDKLNDLITKSGLSSKYILNLALAYKDKFAGTVENATKAPQAAIGRFQTQLDKLKLSIADGGFADAFTDTLARLTAFFKSDDGAKFGKSLTVVMVDLAKLLGLVIENIRPIAAAMGLAFGIKTLTAVVSLGESLQGLAVTGLGAARKGINALGVAVTFVRNELLGLVVASRAAALGVSAGLVGLAGAGGYAFGTWLRNSSADVRKFGVALVGGFIGWIDTIRIAWAQLKFWSPERKAEIDQLKKEAGLHQDSLADQFASENNPATATPNSKDATAKAPDAAAKAQADADVEAARRAADQRKEIAQLSANAVLQEQQTLQDKVDSLTAESLKKDAQTREQYLEAVKLQYKELYREIDAFGKAHGQQQAAAMREQLDKVRDDAVRRAGDKFDTEKVKTDEESINTLIEERNKLIANTNELKKAGQLNDADASAQAAAISAQYNAAIEPKVRALLNDIAALPENVRNSLTVVASDMKLLLATGLNDRVDNSEFDSIKAKAALIGNADREHINALRVQHELLKSHQITQQEYNTAVDQLRTKYAAAGTDAADLLKVIAESTTLTQAQRDALGEVVVKLTNIEESQQKVNEADARRNSLLTGWADELSRSLVALTEHTQEIHNIGDAWIKLRDTARTFFADLAAQIAQALIKAQLLKAALSLSKSSGTAGTIFSAISKVLSNHTGGVVGRDGAPRAAMASWFASAPHYHTGGIAGLKSDEVPTILQRGEEVLTRNDPRHALNGGNGGRSPVSLAVHNHIDTDSLSSAVLGAPGATKSLVNIIRANRNAVKQALT